VHHQHEHIPNPKHGSGECIKAREHVDWNHDKGDKLAKPLVKTIGNKKHKKMMHCFFWRHRAAALCKAMYHLGTDDSTVKHIILESSLHDLSHIVHIFQHDRAFYMNREPNVKLDGPTYENRCHKESLHEWINDEFALAWEKKTRDELLERLRQVPVLHPDDEPEP
jgi:hypothetical protein